MNEVLLTTADVWNGGIERLISMLLQEFAQLHLPTKIAITNPKKCDHEYAEMLAVSPDCIVRAGGRPGAPGSPGKFWRLRNLFRTSAAEIVNIHSSHPSGLRTVECLAARAAGKKVIYSLHHPDSPQLFSRNRQISVRVGLQAVHHVVVTSPMLEAAVRKWGYRGEVSVIRPAATPPGEVSKSAARADLGIPDEAFVIGHFGRLIPEKGLPELAGMVANLANEFPNLFLLAGGSSMRCSRQLIDTVRSKLGERCQCLTDIADVGKFYSACDLFVLPSRMEGFGIVFIEAGACGVPSVAYDVGGVAEAIEDGTTGRLVPAYDERAMEAAVGELIRQPGVLSELGTNARNHARQVACPARMAAEYQALYERFSTSQDEPLPVDTGALRFKSPAVAVPNTHPAECTGPVREDRTMDSSFPTSPTSLGTL